METRRRAHTTGILNRPAITRCCCSTGKEIAWERSCGLATCTALRTGRKCFCQRSSTSRNWARKWCFGPMPRLPSGRSTQRWKNGAKYAIRLPANDSLLRDIEELLTRPVGRTSHKPIIWYKGFLYQAASWKTARRVVATMTCWALPQQAVGNEPFRKFDGGREPEINLAVVSKLKCPLFVASEMSGFVNLP